MEKSPPLPPSRSFSSAPSNDAPLYSPNTIPVNKCKKSKPKHKKAKNSDEAPVQSCRTRSSIYRGVTRHRVSGKYEAHLWDKNWQHPVQKRKGKQVYLGAFHDELDAARAHDLVALKLWGPEAFLNFPAETYGEEHKEMQAMSREEVLASIRRRSSGFARGFSKYRGVSRHHNGRWEARIHSDFGSKYVYLGIYGLTPFSSIETQEEAAQAYDLAVLENKGPNMVTNFASNAYMHCPRPSMQLPVKPGMEPAQEDPWILYMEATETIDQIMLNHYKPKISWTFDKDHDFGAYPLLDIIIDNDPHVISSDLNFEENIEHYFEWFETFEGNKISGSDVSSTSEGA